LLEPCCGTTMTCCSIRTTGTREGSAYMCISWTDCVLICKMLQISNMFQKQVLHLQLFSKEQSSVKPSSVLCFSYVVQLVKQSSVQAAHTYRPFSRDKSDKYLWIELLGVKCLKVYSRHSRESNYIIMELPWTRNSKKGMTVRWVIIHTPQIAMRDLNFWVNSPYWPFCLPVNSPNIMQVVQYLCFVYPE
jgi:hypothetical protein